MRSIILISSHKDEIEKIYDQWQSRAISVNVSEDRFALELKNGRIYIDYLEDGKEEYENSELEKIPFRTPEFYSISYSSKAVLEEFFNQTDFGSEEYIDNDFGVISSIVEIRSKGISTFI